MVSTLAPTDTPCSGVFAGQMPKTEHEHSFVTLNSRLYAVGPPRRRWHQLRTRALQAASHSAGHHIRTAAEYGAPRHQGSDSGPQAAELQPWLSEWPATEVDLGTRLQYARVVSRAAVRGARLTAAASPRPLRSSP